MIKYSASLLNLTRKVWHFCFFNNKKENWSQPSITDTRMMDDVCFYYLIKLNQDLEN